MRGVLNKTAKIGTNLTVSVLTGTGFGTEEIV